MKNILKKARYFTGRALLSVAALFFVALIAVQIILVAGINIVSSGRGSDFIAGKINSMLADSGYKIGFENLYYDPVRGLSVHDLSISDTNGEFLSLDRFSLAASFKLSPFRTLELSARGGTLEIKRIPETHEKKEPAAEGLIKPFDMPDIYFRTIVLSGLSFDHIFLQEAVAGRIYAFSPYLQARVTMGDSIGLNAKIVPGLPALAENMPAPETLNIDGSFTPSTLSFTLKNLQMQSADYGLLARGQGSLESGDDLDIHAQLHHEDLGKLIGSSFKRANVELAAKGSFSAPALDLSALLETDKLKERGLSDIKANLKTESISKDMKGRVLIETVFQNQPVTLGSDIAYSAPMLRLSKIDAAAPDIKMTGNLDISTETFLVDAVISIISDNLAHYSELAGIALEGKINASATLKPSKSGQQTLDASATITSAVFDSIKIKKLDAQAYLESLATPWPQSAKIDLTSLQISSKTLLDTLKADIKKESDNAYKLSLKGNGQSPAPDSFEGSATLSNLMETVPSAGDILLNAKIGTSSARLSGNFTPKNLNIALNTDGFKAADLPISVPEHLKNLRVNLDASMTGAPEKPVTDIAAKLRGLGNDHYKNAIIDIKAHHDGQKASAEATGQGSGIRKLNAGFSAPFVLSLIPFNYTLDKSATLSGKINADIDIASISPLFLSPSQTLSGTVLVNGVITGTIEKPAPAATLNVSSMDFNDAENGVVIAGLQAAASVTPELIKISSLSATDGKAGKLSGGGSAYFTEENATDIHLDMNNFNIPQSDLADGIISAALSLKGSQSGMNLSGKADIAEMNVTIPESFSSNIPQLNIIKDEEKLAPSVLERLTLDITINANNQVFVRGWGLDAEFGGDLAIEGTAKNPQFNGSLSSKRGRYEEFGKRFTLARGDLRFQGSVPPSPYLDIEATTPAGDVTGSVLLTGPVKSPSIKFASTPALPEDEVLSRILFGKEATKISPFQAVQLAQTIRRFSGQGGGSGLDPLGMLRSATGLDDISVETDETGAANIEAGKYLTDNVYLELSKGKAENSGAATIQIEVTPSINIESEIGQDAQGGGGVFWKHDY